MSLAQKLQLLASQRAEAAARQAPDLARQLAEIEARQAELSAQLSLARDARKLLTRYEAKLGSEYQCPLCWVGRGSRSPLTPIPQTTNGDLFRCGLCNEVFEP